LRFLICDLHSITLRSFRQAPYSLLLTPYAPAFEQDVQLWYNT
jgi:hypothetical protein